MSKIAKLECVIADVCFSDYWGGHHLPHIGVPVTHETTLGELKDGMLQELHQGAIAGSKYDEDDESWFNAAEKAIIDWHTETIKINDQWASAYVGHCIIDEDFPLSFNEFADGQVLFPEMKDDIEEFNEDCDEYDQDLPLAWVVFADK